MQSNQGRSPPARIVPGQAERSNFRESGQDGVHFSLKNPRPFSVNDAYVKNLFLPAFRQIFRKENLHLGRAKRVEVENPVDGDLDDFRDFELFVFAVHSLKHPSMERLDKP